MRWRARDLGRDHVEVDALDARRGAGEVLVDERALETDRLEDLRARVGRDGGDAHLRHHLEDALARGLHVVLHRLALGEPATARPRGRRSRIVSNARYGLIAAGAVTEQQREVVHLARLARLDHETHPRARLLAHEVVVHRGGHEQRRDRRALGVGVAVGEDDEVRAARRSPRSPAVRTLSIAMRSPSPPSATG